MIAQSEIISRSVTVSIYSGEKNGEEILTPDENSQVKSRLPLLKGIVIYQFPLSHLMASPTKKCMR
jgi:hypothetical protein